MNPVGKALWYIESHMPRDLSLDEIATGAEVSRFHLTRAFAEATGRSPIRYGEQFDSGTGLGGLEIWVPIKG
jgi:AraC family transcriptional regulator